MAKKIFENRLTIDFMHSAAKAKKTYERIFHDIAKAEKLTQNEVAVLLCLWNNPGYDTASDIVNYRMISKSHVCKAVDSLTERGYLSGRQEAADRRKVHLKIEPPAEKVVRRLAVVQMQFISGLFDGVTEEEQALFEKILDKMGQNMEGVYKKWCSN